MQVICCIAYPLGGHGTNTGDENERALYISPGLLYMLCVRIGNTWAFPGGCSIMHMRTGSVYTWLSNGARSLDNYGKSDLVYCWYYSSRSLSARSLQLVNIIRILIGFLLINGLVCSYFTLRAGCFFFVLFSYIPLDKSRSFDICTCLCSDKRTQYWVTLLFLLV